MKKLISLILVLALVLSMTTVVNAVVETADLKVSLDKTTAKVGDEVTVTVDWKEVMEAVDLELEFDEEKLEFVSASLPEDWIATDRIKNGVVQISWFSMNGQGITNITYKFKVIAEGDATFTTAEAVLADANVESPENYNYGTATLKISNATVEEPDAEEPGTDEPTTEPEKPNTDEPTTEPEKPNTDEPTTDTEKPNTDTNKPDTDTTDEKPTTIPQAGANITQYAIIALSLVAIITLVAIIAKVRKK